MTTSVDVREGTHVADSATVTLLRNEGRSPAMVKCVTASFGGILADAQERGLVSRNVGSGDGQAPARTVSAR